jgi:TfoX/Sxy family transcriptional regulator of competence genes
MAYDEGLAERIRGALDDRQDVSEKRMFGGLAFLIRGNMCVAIVKDQLMVRVGPDLYDQLLADPHAREMDLTGRPMKGFLLVSASGFESDADLAKWVGHGAALASSLPAKTAEQKSTRENKRTRLASAPQRGGRRRVRS